MFAQPRAASAKLAPIQAAYMSSCASARTSCVARGRKRLRRAKLRGPRGHLYASASPGPPQLSSPLYKQLRKTAGQSCRTSTNGQFLARSSPLQAVSEEKDSAGQSFVARGPPACFGQPRAASAQLAPIQAASQDTSANGQFFARSSPLQAVSQAKDSAGQSFVARGPHACFGQPRAASARTAALTSNLSCDSRPSNLDSTSPLAAVIIDCLDFLQHGGRARPHLVGRPRTRSTAYKQLLQTVSEGTASARQSFVARGPPAQRRAKLRGPRAPACCGQPRAASARTAALTSSLSYKACPYKAVSQDYAGQSCVARAVCANEQFSVTLHLL